MNESVLNHFYGQISFAGIGMSLQILRKQGNLSSSNACTYYLYLSGILRVF